MVKPALALGLFLVQTTVGIEAGRGAALRSARVHRRLAGPVAAPEDLLAGLEHIYTGRTWLGVLYLVFCRTFSPSLVAFIEMFLQPGRVEDYKAEVGRRLALLIRVGTPAPSRVRLAWSPSH